MDCRWSFANLTSPFSWPSPAEIQENAEEFKGIAGLPRVVGSIDGTHIPIHPPRENAPAYINRKRFHSLNVQAVCNYLGLFVDVSGNMKVSFDPFSSLSFKVFIGYPGSVHDARILTNSPLHRDAAVLMPPDHFLLGDSGYPLLPWLMTPFKNNGHMTAQQTRFNHALSTTRIVIEQAFGRLKNRWESLKYLHMDTIERSCLFVEACFLLHNICESRADRLDDLLEIEVPNDDDVEHPQNPCLAANPAQATRNQLLELF